MEEETFTPTISEVEQHYIFLSDKERENTNFPKKRNRAISTSTLFISCCNDTTTIVAICVLALVILAFIILILVLLLK
jgi:hypothetical protein